MTTAIEAYLRVLIDKAPDAPPLRDITEADIGTATCTASIARSALAWLLDGTDDAVATRLRQELAESDRIAIWRTRQAWAEFEDALRQQPRGHNVNAAQLAQRRQITPLPDGHPLAQRKPWEGL